jgi:peroxiredoxin
MRADIHVGGTFPDYKLPDHEGVSRRLSDLQGDDPMVIVLAREAYSGKDQRQQQGLVQLWQEMKPGVGYCRLVTITTSTPQETYDYRSGVGAEWPFLSDQNRVLQQDLQIVEYTDPEHNQMVPHTIVCEPGLIVYKIYNGYWFFGRPTLEELRQDLRAVLIKSRWDWDLADPEVAATWARGERDRFFPPDLGWPDVNAVPKRSQARSSRKTVTTVVYLEPGNHEREPGDKRHPQCSEMAPGSPLIQRYYPRLARGKSSIIC